MISRSYLNRYAANIELYSILRKNLLNFILYLTFVNIFNVWKRKLIDLINT